MFASTTLFWAGVIITALHNQRDASRTLAGLRTYVDCLQSAAFGSADTCSHLQVTDGWPITGWNDDNPVLYITVALVTAVRVFPHCM